MHPVAAAISRFVGTFPLRRMVSALSAILLAGGSAILLSGQSPLPVETNPDVIAAALAACDAGDFDDCYAYGRAVLARPRTDAEDTRARDALEQACDGGVTLACYGAGWRYVYLPDYFDLGKARIFEMRGCDAGDERACSVVRRLDHPTPSALEVLAMPWPAQRLANLRWLIFVEENGAELLYGASNTAGLTENETWTIRAASCEMGKADECLFTSMMFAEGLIDGRPEDLPRGIALAKVGCDANLGDACYMMGSHMKERDGRVSDDVRAAFEKSIPFNIAKCDAGDGVRCHIMAEIKELSAVTLSEFDAVSGYYNKGCSAGYDASCQKLGFASGRVQQAQAQAQRREQSPSPTQSATSSCNAKVQRWNEVATATQQSYAAVNSRYVGSDYLPAAQSYSRQMSGIAQEGCRKLLDIAQEAQYSCPAQFDDMLASTVQIHYETGGVCYDRARSMGANYNVERVRR